jgi:transcriptional regulator with XRE-family HTH domain
VTNTDKAKSLRETRKRLGLNQREMAGHLGLDPSYLSQLENAVRPIDEWYLTRATDIEKTIAKNQNLLPDRQKCVDYLEAYLETCGEDAAKLGWTLIVLKENFPLDRWGRAAAAAMSSDTKRALAGSASAQRLAKESKGRSRGK